MTKMEDILNQLRYYAVKLYEDKEHIISALVPNDVKEDFMLIKSLGIRLSHEVLPHDKGYSKFKKGLEIIKEIEKLDNRLSGYYSFEDFKKRENLKKKLNKKIGELDDAIEYFHFYVEEASRLYKASVTTVEEAKKRREQEKKEHLVALEPERILTEPTKTIQTVIKPIEVPETTTEFKVYRNYLEELGKLLSRRPVDTSPVRDLMENLYFEMEGKSAPSVELRFRTKFLYEKIMGIKDPSLQEQTVNMFSDYYSYFIRELKIT